MRGALGGAWAAEAGELALAIAEGRVTLTAAEAPLGDVLAEWPRAGNTQSKAWASWGRRA